MTKTGFGEHLKREREMRGVSLDEICSATRIGTRFLQALEDEEWERLPGGVFNRGFVRGVSRYLGLDEEGMVAEYVTAVNEGKDTMPGWPAKPEPQKATVDWRPWVGAAAVLVLLIAAGWFGWRFYSARRAQRSAAQLAITPPADATAPQTSASSTGLIGGVAGASAAGPADGSAPAVAAPTPADMLLLKIEAGKATSVTVAADGSTAFDGNMIAGQSRSFQAQNELDISAQDAGALLLELNGQTLAPMGPPGHPGKVTLTRSNLKGSSGGAD